MVQVGSGPGAGSPNFEIQVRGRRIGMLHGEGRRLPVVAMPPATSGLAFPCPATLLHLHRRQQCEQSCECSRSPDIKREMNGIDD